MPLQLKFAIFFLIAGLNRKRAMKCNKFIEILVEIIFLFIALLLSETTIRIVTICLFIHSLVIYFRIFAFQINRMKMTANRKIFYLLFLFFYTANISLTAYGSSNTKEYCQNLLDSARKEYIAGNYAKTLEYSSEANILAKANSLIDIQMTALNNIGIVYTQMLDYTKAIDCFLEGYTLAVKENNRTLEMRFLNNIGTVYSADKKTLKANEYIERAYKLALQQKDSASFAIYTSNLGVLANQMGNLDLAKQYLDLSLPLLISLSEDTTFIMNTKLSKAENLYLRGENEKAEELLLKTMEEIPEKHIRSKAECLILLSKVYQKDRLYSKAIEYAHKSLLCDPGIEIKIHIYEQLADLYLENNEPLLTVLYKDSIIIAKDSLGELNNQTQLLNSQIRFELFESEKQLAENKAKQKAERLLFAVIIVFVFIMAIVFIWISRVQSARNKQRKIIAENKQKITELELRQEKNEKLLLEQQLKEQETLTLLEQERLNNEKLMLAQQLKEQELEQEKLNSENKQLAAKVLIQSNRNGLIEEIIQRLSKIPTQSEDSQLQHVIRQLKTQLKESTEWDNSMTYLKQVNPSFLSSLKQKHPDLSVSDIRFLSYLFLNFNTREIADLLNMSLESCQKKRQRLAGKIGVKASELYSYLLTI